MKKFILALTLLASVSEARQLKPYEVEEMKVELCQNNNDKVLYDLEIVYGKEPGYNRWPCAPDEVFTRMYICLQSRRSEPAK